MDAPDTDELMLRELEAAMARVRAAFDANRWDVAVLNLGLIGQDAFRLQGLLGSRTTASADPTIMGFG
jgi:hypothetical protein